MGDERRESKERRAPGWLLFLPALALVFTICFYAPLEMYLLNRSELWFKLSLFWWMPLLFSAVALFVFWVIGRLLPTGARRYYGAMLFAGALCLYVQGNFLNLRIGVLNGGERDWSLYRVPMIRDVAVWCILLLLILLLTARFGERFAKVTEFLSFLMVGVQFVSLVTLLIPVFAERDLGAHVENVQTDAHLYEVGTEGNILVFIVDMFDDDYFRAIMENEEPVLANYDGFTYFGNFTGAYSTTAVSLDFLLTGRMFYNEEPRADWRTAQWEERLWLDEVVDGGYEVGFYTPNVESVPDRMKVIAVNYEEMDLYIKDDVAFFKHLYRLAACKYFPNFVKPRIWMDGTEFNALGEYYNPDNALFRKGMTYNDGLTLAEGRKEFKFIHVNGAHYPYDIGADGFAVEGTTDAYTAATGTLVNIAAYLNEMKANGTYDASAIVITADHGYYWDGVLSNPVCLVKQAGEHGALQINKAPTWQGNLFPALARFAGAEETEAYGTDLFAVAEGDPAERYFYQYYLLEGNVDGNYRMIEYAIPPESNDVTSFQLTNREFTYHGEIIPHAQYCATCIDGAPWLYDQEKPRLVHECAGDNPSASEVQHLETF